MDVTEGAAGGFGETHMYRHTDMHFTALCLLVYDV